MKTNIVLFVTLTVLMTVDEITSKCLQHIEQYILTVVYYNTIMNCLALCTSVLQWLVWTVVKHVGPAKERPVSTFAVIAS